MTGTALEAPPTRQHPHRASDRGAGRALTRVAALDRDARSSPASCSSSSTSRMSLALNDPRGTLGTDTGGKLATLHMMERAAASIPTSATGPQTRDPTGRAAAAPLHVPGRRQVGERHHAADALRRVPALPGRRRSRSAPAPDARRGDVRARRRRRWRGALGGGDGWPRSGSIGLATPVAIYALDFWEHTLGLALMLWGVGARCSTSSNDAPAGAARSAPALLFGVGGDDAHRGARCTSSVAVGLACLVMLVRERALRPSGRASASPRCSAPGSCSSLNRLLEQCDARHRPPWRRASRHRDGFRWRDRDACQGGVHDGGWSRVLRRCGHRPSGSWAASWSSSSPLARGAHERRSAPGASSVPCWSSSRGRVPGSLHAGRRGSCRGCSSRRRSRPSGIVLAWRTPPLRYPAAVAVAALPIAWLAQYSGGADPQWGARYILTSGALLAIAGCVALRGPPAGDGGVWSSRGLVTARRGRMAVGPFAHGRRRDGDDPRPPRSDADLAPDPHAPRGGRVLRRRPEVADRDDRPRAAARGRHRPGVRRPRVRPDRRLGPTGACHDGRVRAG